jgi:hypothetical protein
VRSDQASHDDAWRLPIEPENRHGLRAALGQAANFAGRHSKAPSPFAGASGLHARFERADVGAERCAVDHTHEVAELMAAGANVLHGCHHLRNHLTAKPIAATEAVASFRAKVGCSVRLHMPLWRCAICARAAVCFSAQWHSLPNRPAANPLVDLASNRDEPLLLGRLDRSVTDDPAPCRLMKTGPAGSFFRRFRFDALRRAAS